jgi:hypothetical protein
MTTIATRSSRNRSAAATSVSWREFQYQHHSLSINASEVAVCAGCHEYKSVPELLMGHVYQGIGGQALLLHDARLLGLQLVSEEEQLLEIAAQAGQATTEALHQALQVKRGETKVESVEKAQAMRQHVVEQAKASQKLTKQQLVTLEEQTRYSIDTGCGHSWEDEALDRYERQCGWDVRRRNEELRIWNFERCDIEVIETYSEDAKDPTRLMPSLRPAGPAVPLPRKRKRKTSDEPGDSSSDGREDAPIELTNETEKDLKRIEATLDQPVDADQASSSDTSSTAVATEPAPAYFLSIKGMVDGIREELAPGQKDLGDDDSWILRNVIVECKHRMRSILSYPRFYECIQAVVYCQMYNAEEADIIQVLRKGNESGTVLVQSTNAEVYKVVVEKGTASLSDVEVEMMDPEPMPTEMLPEKKRLLTDYFQRLPLKATETELIDDVMKENREEDAKDSNIVEKKVDLKTEEIDETDVQKIAAIETTIDMEIAVNRISLNDQFNHLHNWNMIILPRLRQWAEGVYRIRQSDELRYRLLSSMAVLQSTEIPEQRQRNIQIAWDLAFEQCPFLRDGQSYDCYRREMSANEP